MKRIIKSLALVAMLTIALVSCNKENESVIPENDLASVSFTFASENPKLIDVDTKTEYTNGTIEWSSGDKIRVGIKVDDTWMAAAGAPEENKYPKLYVSDGLAAGGASAQFKVPASFTLTNTGTYKFYGVYPSSVISDTDAKSLPTVSFTLPASQTPAEGSFDKKADVMFAASEDYSGIPEDKVISLTWSRVVAHADITLKKLPTFAEDETLTSIEVSAQDGADLVGPHLLDITNGTVSLYNSATAVNSITVIPDNITFDNTAHTLEFWFTSLPFTATSLKVVVTTNKKIYTKEYKNISKEFQANRRNALGIGMSNASEEEIVPPDQVIPNGDYVIAYSDKMMLSDDYINSTGSSDSNARAYADLPEVSSDGKVHTNANAVWTFEYKQDGKYSIKSVETGTYLKGAANATYLSLSTDVNTFDGTYDETTEKYQLKVTSGSETRGIGYNISSPRFALYKGGNNQPIDLTLIPAVAIMKCATPVISFEGSTVTISTTTNGAEIYYTLDGNAPTASSTKYTASFDLEETATVKAIAVLEGYENSDVAAKECAIVASKTIAQLLAAGESELENVSNVTIMAAKSGNYIIADATGVMLMYKSGTQIDVQSIINASGSVVTYNGVREFKPTTVTDGTGTPTSYGTPEDFNEASFTAYKTAPVTKYITFKGVAPSSGYDVAIGSNTINVYGDVASELKGNHCIFTGYVFGVVASGNNQGKINFLLTNVVLDTTLPSIEVNPSELVWNPLDTDSKTFTITALNGGFAVSPVSANLSYFSYTVEGNVVTVSLKGEVTENRTENLTITHSSDASVSKTVKLTRKAESTVTSPVEFSSANWTVFTTAGAFSESIGPIDLNCSNGLVTDAHMRIYQSSTFKITSSDSNVKIKKIEITCTASGTSNNGPSGFSLTSGYSYSGSVGTWQGEAQEVSFTVSKQVRATSIKVYFE